MVITGGWPGITRVTAYDNKWHYQFSSIPPLKIGRFDHACGGYDTETGERVSLRAAENISVIIIVIYRSLLLLAV